LGSAGAAAGGAGVTPAEEPSRFDLTFALGFTSEEVFGDYALDDLIQTRERAAGWQDRGIRSRTLRNIAEESVRRVTAPGVLQQESYDALGKLYLWCRGMLKDEDLAVMKTNLLARADEAGLSYGALRGRCDLLGRLAITKPEIETEIAAWVDVSDLQLLATGELRWLRGQLAASDGRRHDQISVVWTGFIEAPATGRYTFSTCPINVSFEHIDWFVRSAMTVWIDGEKVLEANSDNWADAGQPVTLTAGQRKPLRVEFVHSQQGKQIVWPPVALLKWQGPSIERQLVPAGAFSLTAAGDQPGVRGEYKAMLDGEEFTGTRTDAQIDFTWARGETYLPKHPQQQGRLGKELGARYTDADIVAEFAPAADDATAVLPDLAQLAETMSSQQRAAFLQAVAADQSVMAAL